MLSAVHVRAGEMIRKAGARSFAERKGDSEDLEFCAKDKRRERRSDEEETITQERRERLRMDREFRSRSDSPKQKTTTTTRGRTREGCPRRECKRPFGPRRRWDFFFAFFSSCIRMMDPNGKKRGEQRRMRSRNRKMAKRSSKKSEEEEDHITKIKVSNVPRNNLILFTSKNTHTPTQKKKKKKKRNVIICTSIKHMSSYIYGRNSRFRSWKETT